jgi:hypothetical protein
MERDIGDDDVRGCGLTSGSWRANRALLTGMSPDRDQLDSALRSPWPVLVLLSLFLLFLFVHLLLLALCLVFLATFVSHACSF